MSASLRTRALVLAASAAVVLPLSIAAAGSANAIVDGDLLGGVTGGGLPVVGDLTGGGLPVVGDLTEGDAVGTVTGLVGAVTGGTALPVGGDALGTAGSAAADPTALLEGGATDGLTDDLTDTVGSLIDDLDVELLNDLDVLNGLQAAVPVNVCGISVLGTAKADCEAKAVNAAGEDIEVGDKSDRKRDKDDDNGDDRDGDRDGDRKSVVRAGTLPKTGGSADMTAMLLCAGLAAAGTGVTLITRRRNALGLGA